MDQRRRSTIFEFKNIIILAFILIIYTNQIAGMSQKCESLGQCVKSITQFKVIPTVSSREDLQNTCLKLDEGLACARDFQNQCMTEEERNSAKGEFEQATAIINEICKQGPYQEELLQHAPCLHRAINDYENCKGNMVLKVQNLKEEDGNDKFCCIKNEYKKCIGNAVQKLCGEKTAQFSKSFIDRTSNKESLCTNYDDRKCNNPSSIISRLG